MSDIIIYEEIKQLQTKIDKVLEILEEDLEEYEEEIKGAKKRERE